MKKITRTRTVNALLWSLLLSACFYDGFIAADNNSFSQGQTRGIVLFVAAFLLIIYPGLTIFYTLKSGADRKKVTQNLKHNYLMLISLELWKTDHKIGKNEKVVTVEGVKFERWRIFQGLLINGVFLALCIGAIPDWSALGLFISYWLVMYVIFLSVYIKKKGWSRRKAFAVAFMKVFVFPTTPSA